MTAPLKPLPGAVADGLALALGTLGADPNERTGEARTLIAVASAPKAGDTLAMVDDNLARVVSDDQAAALDLQSWLSDMAGAPVPMRRRLGNRRAHWTVEFEHAGIRYTAGVGRFEDDPGADLAEVFFNVPGKAGTPLESHVRDEAIAASLALQFGCPVDTLRGALTRNVDGTPSGALGKLLEILETEQVRD
jgi:hypothetical protein